MQSFYDAQKGINKIFTSVVLRMISLALATIANMIIILTDIQSLPSFFFESLLTLTSIILITIAFCFNIIGLGKASKDEGNLRSAFTASIFGIVITGIGGLLKVIPSIKDSPFVKSFSYVTTTVSSIIEVLVIILVCLGVSNLLHIREEETLANRGNSAATVSALAYSFSIICQLIVSITSEGDFISDTIGVVLSLTSLVLGIVAYVRYFIFLYKSRNKLA